jgi:hypothetical protein
MKLMAITDPAPGALSLPATRPAPPPSTPPPAAVKLQSFSRTGERIVIKWGIITFAAGIVLIIIEIMVARKKKEGFTRVDMQRVQGLFGITVFLTALVMGLIWMT